MIVVMEAVGVLEMAVCHAQQFCLPVHLFHKHTHRLTAGQVASSQFAAGCYRNGLGSIVAAGKHHTGDQLADSQFVTHLQLCHRGVLLHQAQSVTHLDDLLRIHMLQHHIAGQQLRDAGRIQLGGAVAHLCKIRFLPDVIGKIVIRSNIPGDGLCFRRLRQYHRLRQNHRFRGCVRGNGYRLPLGNHRFMEKFKHTFCCHHHAGTYQHYDDQHNDLDFYN